MRILIADDHAVVRRGLRQILAAKVANLVRHYFGTQGRDVRLEQELAHVGGQPVPVGKQNKIVLGERGQRSFGPAQRNQFAGPGIGRFAAAHGDLPRAIDQVDRPGGDEPPYPVFVPVEAG